MSRICPKCNVWVIRTSTARTCRKCGREKFKRIHQEIRERIIQAKRRRTDAEPVP